MISSERAKAYGKLEAKIGKTALVRYNGEVPNGNNIWIKREFDNPFGSHYDRVYLELFRHYESSKIITPGSKVIETTSGTAGVSFAGIGKLLRYDCYVILPEGGEKARETALLEQLPDKNHLIFSSAKGYVSALPHSVGRYLVKHRDFIFLNHSMGPNKTENLITLEALKNIGDEIQAQLKPDYFIPAVGNGSSVLGPASALCNVTVVGFETVQSAVAFNLLHPGRYEADFGIKPGTLSRHRLPGTSFQGIDFPHIKSAIKSGILKDVVLVSDQFIDAEYQGLTGRDTTKGLIHWDKPIADNQEAGRTTRAGINVALEISTYVTGKNLVVIGYDKANRYDSE